MEDLVTAMLASQSGFWTKKRVLLTGHTGFKGSWMSLWLQALGAEVTGYALPTPAGNSLFEVARVGDAMRSVMADVRDLTTLTLEMKNAGPEIVIHMAAQALVRESYAAPLETYSTNVMGTANVLEAVRATPEVRAVICVTSDKCYENREWQWGYRERDRLGGYDPYSSSKACAELVASAYRSSFFNPESLVKHRVGIATARAGNVIGGGDWGRDRLIPDVLAALKRGETLRVRYPKAVRPWQHVLEPLSGYLRLAEALSSSDCGCYSEAWNFGPSEEEARPVRWIVERMIELWGGGATWEQELEQQPHEAASLRLDCSKARSVLGWMPRWHLAKALAVIVDWQRAFEAGHDMRETTLGQIRDFENGSP